MEANQEKIVYEAEQQGNVGHWLSREFKVTMDEALVDFRQEYLTFLGSNARTLSTSELYDAIADIYKKQLKSVNYLARALEDHSDKQKSMIVADVKDYFDRLTKDTAGINSKLRQSVEKLSQTSIDYSEASVKSLQEAFIKLFEHLQNQIAHHNEVQVAISQMNKKIDKASTSQSTEDSTSSTTIDVKLNALNDEVSALKYHFSTLQQDVNSMIVSQ